MATTESNERQLLLPLTNSKRRSSSSQTNSFESRGSLFLWLSAVLERFSFYSIANNLFLFLTSESIEWNTMHSVVGVSIFLGKSFPLAENFPNIYSVS